MIAPIAMRASRYEFREQHLADLLRAMTDWVADRLTAALDSTGPIEPRTAALCGLVVSSGLERTVRSVDAPGRMPGIDVIAEGGGTNETSAFATGAPSRLLTRPLTDEV